MTVDTGLYLDVDQRAWVKFGVGTTVAPPSPPVTVHGLVYSTTARLSPVPLDGAVDVPDTAHVFLTPTTPDIISVTFYADNVLSTTERTAPYDFRGAGTTGAPNPLNLPAGAHTARADVVLAGGSSETVQAAFTVASATTVTQPPPVPNPAQGVIGPTSVQVTWVASSTATGYGVYLNGVKQGADTTALSFTFSGLSPSTTYTVGVDAGNAAGRSAQGVIAVTTSSSTPTKPAAPLPSKGAVSSTSAGINWTSVSGATGYGVYVGGIKQGADLTSGAIGFTFTGLTASTGYTLGVDAVNAAGRSAVASVAVTTAPAGTTAGDARSYWTSAAPVSHGRELDPSAAKKAGLPPGWVAKQTLSSPTFTGGTVADVQWTGTATCTGPVTFLRCKGTAVGYSRGSSAGSSANALACGTQDVTAIDCEFYGGAGASAVGGRYFYRCLLTEGNDLWNIRGNSPARVIECVYDGIQRASTTAHPDAIQATTNTGSTTLMNVLVERSWVNVYNRRTGDLGNAAYQQGGFGTGSGITIRFDDCFMDGGNFTVNCQKVGTVGDGCTLHNVDFGSHHRYGTITGSVAVV